MQLSIIIINFNTFQLTVECIQSIQNHIGSLSYEIILVDNAPLEDYEEAFLSRFPEIIYERVPENIGFGKANNLGMARAKGKYLLLINSDTFVIDDSLQRCYHFMEEDRKEEIGVLGCKLVDENLKYQPSFFPFRKNNLFNFLLANNWLLDKIFKTNVYFKETNKVLQVGDVSGAFMLVRRKIVDEVLAFDPDFFLYCEETEWCRERIAKKYKIIYYPLAAIIHYGGKSAPKEPMFVQSKLSLLLLWYKKGWVLYILFIIVAYINSFFHILLLPFLPRESRKIIMGDIKAFRKVSPYIFTEIIKYDKAWGSRKEPLIYEGARSIFFKKKETVLS